MSTLRNLSPLTRSLYALFMSWTVSSLTVLKKECQPWLHQSLWWKKISVLDIFHSRCGPIDRWNCMLIEGCWQQIRHRMTRKLDVSQWDGLSYQECRRRSLHHCNRISFQTLALALKKKRLTIKFLFSWQIGTLFHIYNRVFANQVEEVDKYLYSKLTSLCTLTLTVYVFLSQSFFLELHIQMMLRLKL